jgi:microcystin degradation protein MlrC
MKIAISGLYHETNTFADKSMGLTSLADFRVLCGSEIVQAYGRTRTGLGGMLDAAEMVGATVCPTFHAFAMPSGTITAGAYSHLKAELLARLRAELPVDAVALELHGAGVAEDVADIEGDVASAVRELVGPQTPIVIALDLHGNITHRLANAADMLFGSHCYPHIDLYERGYTAISAVPKLLNGQWHPDVAVEDVPMLLPLSCTEDPPARSINELCRSLERDNEIIDCTFFHGFSFADVPFAGVRIVSTANGDDAAAKASARLAAKTLWDRREEFRVQTELLETVVSRAIEVGSARGAPVVIGETSDNPGGGAPGDGTHLLRAILDAHPLAACYGYIYDPEVAAQAHQSGTGTTIDVLLGGKYGELQGGPLGLSAYVHTLTDGLFKLVNPAQAGLTLDLGPMARLQVRGVDIIVGSRRSQTHDPGVFLLHGIDISRYQVVGLKSSVHFRAGFEGVAAECVTVDPPGLTSQRIEDLSYYHLRRPTWPIDQEAIFPGEDL